ncbi:MAG: single-stranded DNA-binding protein [Saprospiraceae bacterium]
MNTLKNSVQLIGNLGKDIELKEITNGTKVAHLTIATNDYYKNAKGETIQDTQWHNLVAWGKQAENMSKSLTKGSELAIKGKLMHRSYEDKEGVKRYTTEIKVNEWIKISRVEKEPTPF